MKNKLLSYCLLGAPIGLSVSTIITIIISLSVGDGRFYAVVPELITDCGTEIRAVLLQAVCSLLYGAAWAGASLIWKLESWSLLRQTVTHLIVCSVCTLPVAYFMRWMPHSAAGILCYFAVFFGVYLIIWLWQYFATKRRIQQMNSKLAEADRTQA